MVDLENEPSQGASYQSPIIKPATRVNSLEEALAQSPHYDSQFVSKLKSRYGQKERERERLVSEETLHSKVLTENRQEWEQTIEERLRKQLEITTKPVIDERAKLVVTLPEITPEMNRVIDTAFNGHGEAQVLCDDFNITITRKDMKTLAGLNWLNDQVSF